MKTRERYAERETLMVGALRLAIRRELDAIAVLLAALEFIEPQQKRQAKPKTTRTRKEKA
ncbi:MAG: hypothetical protein ACKV22_09770 [Bryobacteraceae bacterium]